MGTRRDTFELRGRYVYVNPGDREREWMFYFDGDGGAMNYLLHVCPTTKDAVAKLATMRRAVRAVRTAKP